MTYIPATDAAVYKTSAITRMVAQGAGGGGKEEEEERPPRKPPLQPPTIEKANGGGTTVISIGGGGGPPAQKGSGESERALHLPDRILAWWIGLSRTMGPPSFLAHFLTLCAVRSFIIAPGLDSHLLCLIKKVHAQSNLGCDLTAYSLIHTN